MQITVIYWRGTTQVEAMATTYEEAMALADLNQNAYPARFYDEDGEEVFDDGYGLAYMPDDKNRINYAV